MIINRSECMDQDDLLFSEIILKVIIIDSIIFIKCIDIFFWPLFRQGLFYPQNTRLFCFYFFYFCFEYSKKLYVTIKFTFFN